MEVCSCYLFSEIKCTLVRFLKCVIGYSLAETVKITNTRISIKLMQTDDLIVKYDGPAKIDIEIKSDMMLI